MWCGRLGQFRLKRDARKEECCWAWLGCECVEWFVDKEVKVVESEYEEVRWVRWVRKGEKGGVWKLRGVRVMGERGRIRK